MDGRQRHAWVKAGVMGGALAAVTLAAASHAAAQAIHQRLAPIELTGTWVSVVTEDWHLRMIAPQKGDFEGMPLNEDGLRVAGMWDPERDVASGDACKAYGAPAIMRVPGRVRISWQDGGNTLQIQTDAGRQTRLLHFARVLPRGRAGRQGHSVASWVYGGGFDPLVPHAANERQEDRARAAGGTLKVVTTNLTPGYLRKNGVPFSEKTSVTEYFELMADPRGTPWFVVTTIVSDPTYLLRDFITSSNFKKEPDDSRWRPTACTVE